MGIIPRKDIKIELPASHKIDTYYLMDQKKNTFHHKLVFQHFLNEGRLTKLQVESIIKTSVKILKKEPNLLRINKKAFIVGDIHGQLYDLKSIIEKFNLHSDVLLFLGDYVDRGSFSLECYVYLLLLKIEFPENVFLLRGNHESFAMTSHFTFMNEVCEKYDSEVYGLFKDSFKALPLAAIVLGKAFCCHGGISPSMEKVDEINTINRFDEIPHSGLFCDLMWSDPHPDFQNKNLDAFEENVNRNCSYFYGYEAVKSFLDKNNLDTIFRGHEVQKLGYKKYKNYRLGIPSVHTIFSAPNYCDVYGNSGAIAYYDAISIRIFTFEAKSHPQCNKNFIDIINQTLPFISEKITEFYLDILKLISSKEVSSNGSTISEPAEIEEEMVKTADFATNMALMRVERESIEEFIEDDPLVLNAENCIAVEGKMIEDYNEAHKLDEKNEKIMVENEEMGGISIPISPSLSHEALKHWEDTDINELLDKVKLDAGEKEIRIDDEEVIDE